MTGASFTPLDIYIETRKKRPLVYQITNRVSAQVQADTVALLGGLSVMSDAKEEAAEIARKSDALLINLGTPRDDAFEIFSLALGAAQEKNVPAVLDLVGYGFTQYRTALANKLLETFRFAIIKGNAAEISALAGAGKGPTGVSSNETAKDMGEIVRALSTKYNACVFSTGEQDFLAGGDRCAATTGGSAYLGALSGIGCALGSAAALFSAGAPAFEAAFSGLLAFRCAATKAAHGAKGSGSFYRNFQDELALLGSENVDWSVFYETR